MRRPMVTYTMNRNGICEDVRTCRVVGAGGETAVAGAQVTKTNDIWHTSLFTSEKYVYETDCFETEQDDQERDEHFGKENRLVSIPLVKYCTKQGTKKISSFGKDPIDCPERQAHEPPNRTENEHDQSSDHAASPPNCNA